MSFLTAEQVIAANKANVETLFGLTNKAFEGVEKLVELNLQVAKSTLTEAADATKAIAASTNAEVGKVAEVTAADAQKKFMAVVDTAVKNAPAGTENAVALVKSAVAAANNAYESVHKAAKQAADMAEANFTAVTDTAVKASKASSKPARRAA